MKVRIALASALAALVTTGSVASAISYSQNFDPYANGTTNLGDGTDINSNTGVASVQSGELRLTLDGQTGARSSFRIPALTHSSHGWTASFNFFLQDAAGGNEPADGFSFSYGAIPAFPGGPSIGNGNAEEGFGSGNEISYEFDTWRIGDSEHGFNVSHNGTDLAPVVNTDIIPDGGTVNGFAVLQWHPGNGLTMTVDLGSGPVTHFLNVPDGAFVGNDNFSWVFSARTGGATETLTIDNLVITTVPEPSTLLLGLAGVLGIAGRRRRHAC